MISRRFKILLLLLFFLFVLIGNPFFHNHSPKITESPHCPVYLLNLVLSAAFVVVVWFLFAFNLPQITPFHSFEKFLAPQPHFITRFNRAPPQK